MCQPGEPEGRVGVSLGAARRRGSGLAVQVAAVSGGGLGARVRSRFAWWESLAEGAR
jgi:hypothetical protein